ncbi:MAG: hypothetical protein WBY66_18610, partial [Candidatus Acidiferrales bacterium]
KSGYLFTFANNGIAALTTGIPAACGGSGDTGFSVTAAPISLSTGTAAYCIDETGVVRVDSAATVGEVMNPCSTSGKPPLQLGCEIRGGVIGSPLLFCETSGA